MFCGCWTDAQQLIFLRLWPATATRPEVAFHWDLMSWLRTMSLECHASLKSLCEALRWMSPPTLPTLVMATTFTLMESIHICYVLLPVTLSFSTTVGSAVNH